MLINKLYWAYIGPSRLAYFQLLNKPIKKWNRLSGLDYLEHNQHVAFSLLCSV